MLLGMPGKLKSNDRGSWLICKNFRSTGLICKMVEAWALKMKFNPVDIIPTFECFENYN